jgi:hypothetical protein
MDADKVNRRPVAHALLKLDDALNLLGPLQAQHTDARRAAGMVTEARELLNRAVRIADTEGGHDDQT